MRFWGASLNKRTFWHSRFMSIIGTTSDGGIRTQAAHLHSRQKGYASHFRKSFVYTPQMVVQGVTEATGSDEYTVKRLIKQAGSAPDVPIDITQNKSGGLTVTISAGRRPAHAGVWVALFDREHKTAVKRGENRGRLFTTIMSFATFRRLATGGGTRWY